MYLEIVTPETVVLSAEVQTVTVPGINGEFQMLDNHAPVVSLLGKGNVKIAGDIQLDEKIADLFTKGDNNQWLFPITSGVIEMKDNKVIVLSD